MKISKELIILSIIIGGLLFYVIQRKDDRINYELPDIPPVAQKELTRIELSKWQADELMKAPDEIVEKPIVTK